VSGLIKMRDAQQIKQMIPMLAQLMGGQAAGAPQQGAAPNGAAPMQ
jgi:hypothetical protein